MLSSFPKEDNTWKELAEGNVRSTDMYIVIREPKYQKGAIQLNSENDYIENVPEEIWNMYFGGYQGCVLAQRNRHHNSED